MEIKLDTPKEIIIREAETVITDKILLNEFTDTGTSVIALVTLIDGSEMPKIKTKIIILWEGKDYIMAGQYTDDDINKRIKELL